VHILGIIPVHDMDHPLFDFVTGDAFDEIQFTAVPFGQ
jgi:hypothetical protein